MERLALPPNDAAYGEVKIEKKRIMEWHFKSINRNAAVRLQGEMVFSWSLELWEICTFRTIRGSTPRTNRIATAPSVFQQYSIAFALSGGDRRG